MNERTFFNHLKEMQLRETDTGSLRCGSDCPIVAVARKKGVDIADEEMDNCNYGSIAQTMKLDQQLAYEIVLAADWPSPQYYDHCKCDINNVQRLRKKLEKLVA